METTSIPVERNSRTAAGAPGAATPDVAVVLATYRRPALLRRCLAALVAQQGIAPDRYEIVVVDDGCTDDTRDEVASFARATGGAPPVRYLRPEGNRGPAAARNRGWRAAHAPVIAFTDDDTVPDARWLAEALAALEPGLMALSGRVVVPVDGPPTDHARMTQGLETAEFVTANAIVRRRALEEIGGFDERFKRAWREDSDLHFALLERYGAVGRAAAAIVVHPVRPARWGISLGQQENVYYDALLYRKHPRLYLQRIRRAPPWRYLAIVVATVAAAGAGLAGRPLAAAALAAIALALCLSFAWRRLRGASRAPSHVLEMLVTSLAIPYLAVFWRLRGAWRFKVLFP